MVPAGNYFLQRTEPDKSCLLALRSIILNYHEGITEAWKYGMPFYCYKGKMLCYLWTHKKYKQPYLGIVDGKLIDHPLLITENRARMKILLFDPEKDIPIDMLSTILEQLIGLRN